MVTRYALMILIYILTATAAHAVEAPSLKTVAANPKAFVGKTISFRNASCVDDPKGGFLCIVSDRAHTIRIEAGSLGMSGGDVVADRLTGPCKGKAKIGTPLCRFNISIEPNSAQSEAVMLEFEGERVTRFYAGAIEMELSKK